MGGVIEDDPVRPRGAHEEGPELGLQRVEGDLEELLHGVRDVHGGLGAAGEVRDGRKREGDEVDDVSASREPLEVPRGGEEGDPVAPPGQGLGEAEEGDEVAHG